jgi:hypothetical protein
MPKDPHFVMTKSDPYGKSRKSRKKRRAARRPAPPVSKRAPLPERIPAAPSAQVTPPIQQVVAQQPQVLGELKRIGIITGALLLLLIIVSLVL